MATGFTTTVGDLEAIRLRAHEKVNETLKRGLRAAMIPDGGWEAAPHDAGEAVKEAAAPQPPIEWTKYPPARDPFADKDAKR